MNNMIRVDKFSRQLNELSSTIARANGYRRANLQGISRSIPSSLIIDHCRNSSVYQDDGYSLDHRMVELINQRGTRKCSSKR